MAESDKPGQKKTTTRKTTNPASRKKVTRAPVIDLEATEIPEKPAAGTTSKPESTQPAGESKTSASDTAGKDDRTVKAETPASAAPAPSKQPDDAKKSEPAKPDSKKPDQKSSSPNQPKSPAGKTDAGLNKPAETEKGSSSGKPAQPGDGPAAAPKSTTPPAREEKTGMLAFAGAGAAGAFACFVIIAGLDQLDLIPWNSSSPDEAAVTQRFDALEKQVAELSSKTATSPDYGERVVALESGLRDISKANSGLAGDVSGQRDTVGKLEAKLQETTVSAEAALAGVKEIEASVRAIGQSTAEGDDGPSVSALALKLSSLSSRLDTLSGDLKSSMPQDLAGKLSAVDGNVAGLKASVEEIRTSLAKLDAQLNTLPVAANTQGLADLKGDVSGRLEAIEARLGGPGETRGAAAAIALAGLRRAIGTGAGFANEFAAFKSLVPDDPLVATVEPHAQNGIPTRDALAERFISVLSQINASGDGKSKSDDLVGGLMARLESVVKVRKTGADDAHDEASVAARMAQHLKAGDLKAAVDGAKSIVGAVSPTMAGWVTLAEARLSAETALDDADQRMLAALARTGD